MASSCRPCLSNQACVHVSSPKPIYGIVHSVWLSWTHTASCLRGSHEPVLPPRKEMFVTHGPVSHDYAVQTQKASLTEKNVHACKLIFSALSLDNVVFPPRNWNYSKLNHIMTHERNPLQKHILIKKTKRLLSWSPQPMHPTQPPTLHFSWTRTYSLVHAQTVGQWDCEREGDHLSQSALMIVYQRLEEWSGSRWWKQALWRDHSNQICSSTQQSWGSPAQTHQPT